VGLRFLPQSASHSAPDPADLQSVQLRSERSGNDPTETGLYTITLVAIDVAGNLSEPYEFVIPGDHDQG
jgi:hypothetical protein